MWCELCHAAATLRVFEDMAVCQSCYRTLMGDGLYRLLRWLALPRAS